MNMTRLQLAGSPTKSGMTFNAPHLVTTIYFENSSAAFRTRPGVFCQQFSRRHIIRIASVLCFRFWDVASCASVGFAKTAFPLRAQKSSARFNRTSADKLSSGCRRRSHSLHSVQNIFRFIPVDLILYNNSFFSAIITLTIRNRFRIFFFQVGFYRFICYNIFSIFPNK